MSATTIQLGITSGAFGEGGDDYMATLRAQRDGRLRVKPPHTHCEMRWTQWLVSFQAVRQCRLTVVMIYRLGGKCFDGKCVRDDLYGSSGRTVLARGRHTDLRGLSFGLHGIFSTDVSTGHKKEQRDTKDSSTRWRLDSKRVACVKG